MSVLLESTNGWDLPPSISNVRYPQQAIVGYGNNYNHAKILDVFLDLNYFSFSHPNPTQLPMGVGRIFSWGGAVGDFPTIFSRGGQKWRNLFFTPRN